VEGIEIGKINVVIGGSKGKRKLSDCEIIIGKMAQKYIVNLFISLASPIAKPASLPGILPEDKHPLNWRPVEKRLSVCRSQIGRQIAL
jgi:hypothetical protein